MFFSQHLQDMDEKRICRLREFIRMCADTEKNVMPILHTCIEGIHRAAEKVDPCRVSFYCMRNIIFTSCMGINTFVT